ncbi:hypothetical protein GBA52_026775 [Prunus armeniaca]|nr:hypothetical protein GBA52_026775 [Prunus armeniaca]
MDKFEVVLETRYIDEYDNSDPKSERSMALMEENAQLAESQTAAMKFEGGDKSTAKVERVKAFANPQ